MNKEDEERLIVMFNQRSSDQAGQAAEIDKLNKVLGKMEEAFEEIKGITGVNSLNEMVDKFGVLKVALVHRTGVVPVGEASVVILVSSVHRQPALRAVEYGIEELKARTAIWKREVYEDGSVWKENMEFERERKVHGCCRGGGKQEEV